MKQETMFDKNECANSLRIEGFVLKIMFKKALFLKIIFAGHIINQSFGFVNRLTAQFVIKFYY
jgi:hypothetical protein